MRTRLARFSSEFDAVVRPVLAPLHEASDALAHALQPALDPGSPDPGGDAGEAPDRELLPDLHELHHQLEILVEKVAEQQAFLLIFGPLKSGKSTLMNALSAEYVSEVTSLPAYPCMVYVSHADTKSYRLTRYDGKVEELRDAAALRLYVQRAHGELAARIREVEDEGGAFDPAVHLPTAIRRLDIRVPAGELEPSGAVLVDTPGLYSRMKFGYDRMTREFRNSAACAMFVVKTDNLFLEQVFEEFNELLELFSRIFLVVNVDTTKADLGPDGELVPSLEQSDPLRLIEAFENLSMNAPLKQAAEEGRLRIYPVDLLRAASWRLRRAGSASGSAPDAASGVPEAYQGQASFEAFLGDLTEFLNSTDYINAFLHDSLRRARTLLGDVAEVCDRPSVKALLGRLADLERAREEGRLRGEALERLERFPWDGALTGVRERLGEAFALRVKEVEQRTSAALDAALDEWFTTDASLQTLLIDRLVPILKRHNEELSTYARETLARDVLDETGGMTVPQELRADLALCAVSLEQLARDAMRRAGPLAAAVPPEPPFAAGDVPVRRTVGDWVLFRSRANVRRRLLGPPEQPSHRIAAADKVALLGEVARRAMRQKLDLFTPVFFGEAAGAVPQRVLTSYEACFRMPLLQDLADRRRRLDDELATLDERIDELLAVKRHVTGLERLAASGLIEVSAMSARLQAEAQDTSVLVPAPRPDEGALPKPARLHDVTTEPTSDAEVPGPSADDPFASLERGTTD